MQSLINRRRTYYHHNKFEHNWLRLIPEADGGTITFKIKKELSTTDYEYVEYSLDAGKTWVRTYNTNGNSEDVSVSIANVKQERAVCFRGKGTKLSLFNSNNNFSYSPIRCTVTHRVEGDVKSMLYLDDFENKGIGDFGIGGLFCRNTTLRSATDLNIDATSMGIYSCCSMFEGCTSLLSTPDLPCTSLAYCCYQEMFKNCASLVNAPSLPATTLANNCYKYMFKDCVLLVNTPTLSGTLAESCYYGMFRGCRSLTSAPALSKTSLQSRCYQEMFTDCNSLVNAPALPATTLKSSCYESMFQGCSSLTTAPTISATTLADYCCYCMFAGCVSLVNAPALPATTLKPHCYQDMFNGCTSLTSAPVLKAKTLVDSCYNGMFVNCSRLNYIKALFKTTPSTSYTWNWVIHAGNGSGTFVKNSTATWNVRGDSGIPNGWTVQTASS